MHPRVTRVGSGEVSPSRAQRGENQALPASLLHPCPVDTVILQERQREPCSKDLAGPGLDTKPLVQTWLWVQAPRRPRVAILWLCSGSESPSALSSQLLQRSSVCSATVLSPGGKQEMIHPLSQTGTQPCIINIYLGAFLRAWRANESPGGKGMDHQLC